MRSLKVSRTARSKPAARARVQELLEQASAEAPSSKVRVEHEEPHARDAVALVGHREAAGVLAVPLHDPDRLGFARKAPQSRARDGSRHVGLEARVDAVLGVRIGGRGAR